MTTQGRLFVLGVLQNGDRWDRGRIRLRECVPLFLSHTKTIDFLFPALSEELSNISFQRPPHGRHTWTRVWQVPGGGALSPEGKRADKRLISPFSTPCMVGVSSVACWF